MDDTDLFDHREEPDDRIPALGIEIVDGLRGLSDKGYIREEVVAILQLILGVMRLGCRCDSMAVVSRVSELLEVMEEDDRLKKCDHPK